MTSGGIGRFARRKGAAPSAPPPAENAPPSNENANDPSVDDGMFGHSSFDTDFGADSSAFSFGGADFGSSGADFGADFGSSGADFDMGPSTDIDKGLPPDNSGFDLNAPVVNHDNSFLQANTSAVEIASSTKDNASSSGIPEGSTKPTGGVGGKPLPPFGKRAAAREHTESSFPAPASFMGDQGSSLTGARENTGATAASKAPGISMFSHKRRGQQPQSQEGSSTPTNHSRMDGQPQNENHAFSSFDSVDEGAIEKSSFAEPHPMEYTQTNMDSDAPPPALSTGTEALSSKDTRTSVTPVPRRPNGASNQYKDMRSLQTPDLQDPLTTPSPRTGGAWPSSSYTEKHLEQGVAQTEPPTYAPPNNNAGSYQEQTTLVTPRVESNQEPQLDSGVSPMKPVMQGNESAHAHNLHGKSASRSNLNDSDDSFDGLFSRFLIDLRDSTDLTEKGEDDLLDREVELAYAYSLALQYKCEMMDTLEALDSMESAAKNDIQLHGGV